MKVILTRAPIKITPIEHFYTTAITSFFRPKAITNAAHSRVSILSHKRNEPLSMQRRPLLPLAREPKQSFRPRKSHTHAHTPTYTHTHLRIIIRKNRKRSTSSVNRCALLHSLLTHFPRVHNTTSGGSILPCS